MRIAALFDVHGNLPALQAVLAEDGARDADLVASGGDQEHAGWLLDPPDPFEVSELFEAQRGA